ncbi:hypothetical protein SISSUDRAFT_1072148 [Sistotremastrum suecicum HHB10207 ss-3]|uniref:Amino acid transporter transmembrane domain-containing protein n=1 Tax=Sistotremastrum suecicum HHB10207 ss-3 TaxID=1314776 RepID=A0A165ZJ83_9AGAM|nr:hypothetical protein SISSUDRAFT_1072148 [Sistotremastrum suecicum HHB10207 ss-3]
MASSGLIPGIFTCLFSGTVAATGLYLLSECATRAPHRRASWFAFSKMTFPSAAVFFDLAIAIKCFGVSISYLIIIKGLMPNVIASLYHDLFPGDAPDWTQSPRVWLTLFMLVLVPLCFLRKLDSLRHTSYVALFAVVYLVIIVVVCYISPLKGTVPRGNVYLWHFTPSFVGNFPVQVFAFTCAQNILPIYNELRDNSRKRMNTIIGTAIGSATATYEVIAILGYLTFGDKVRANIIQMYPSTSLFIAIGQLAIVILVLFSYPLQVLPCRNSLDKVVTYHPPKPTVTKIATPPSESETSTVVAPEAEEEEEDTDPHAVGHMSAEKHFILTAGIVALGFLVAFFVSDLRIVLSFVGSTGSTTISFILPGLFYWKLFQDDPEKKVMRRIAFAVMIYGILILVFCLSYNIYATIAEFRAGSG